MVHLPVTRRILRKARYGFGNIHCCRFTTNAWDIVSRCDGALWSSSTVVLLFTAGLSVEGGSRCAARQGPTGLILIGAGGSHSSTEVRPTCSNYTMGCCLVLMNCQKAIWEGRISSLLGSAALRPTVTGQAGKTMPALFRTRQIHLRLMSSPTLLMFGLSRKTLTLGFTKYDHEKG